ncbi:MAG: BlaI/MecI/CopY family transcriptional regulator [Armatimonadota bacterium]|nr:BlaI/MecI/CopY family transcriptional regulator [Armatimonadota bacterium]
MTRSNRITEMGELQLDVFERLAELGEAAVYDVLEAFDEERRPKYTTVLTVLRALEEKGLATHRTEGRTYVFEPVVSAGHVRRQLLRSVMERVFGGSPKRLMAALLDDEAVTPDVMRELRALLEETEGAHDDDADR